eukprot:m.773143 g.773143  ORF g.773143 m.773143 type:complete len:72 (+) comp23248_c0_seq66:456-671(+)
MRMRVTNFYTTPQGCIPLLQCNRLGMCSWNVHTMARTATHARTHHTDPNTHPGRIRPTSVTQATPTKATQT